MTHNILLIDDDDVLLEALQIMFMRAGNPLLKAFSSASDALNWLETCNENNLVIITDLNMPQMSGVDFAANFLKTEQAKTAKILFMSGSSDTIAEHDQEMFEKLPLIPLIQKPSSIDGVKEILNEIGALDDGNHTK